MFRLLISEVNDCSVLEMVLDVEFSAGFKYS